MKHRGPLAVLGFCSLLLAACGGGEDSGNPPTAAEAADWDAATDPRIHPLLDRPCPEPGPFSADTSHLLPRLVDKLGNSQREVLRYLSQELAEAGDAAVPELERFILEHFSERHAGAALENALDVLERSETESAGEVLGRCLQHPAERVRLAAAKALARHGQPEHFSLLLSLFEGLHATNRVARQVFVAALVTSDAPRFARELAGWMRAGRNEDAWLQGTRLLLAQRTDELAALLGPELVDEDDREDELVRIRLLGFHLTDSAPARAAFEAHLFGPDLSRRTAAMEVVEDIDRVDLALEVFEREENPGVRGRAIALLGLHAGEEGPRAALRHALNDPNPAFVGIALESLLGTGDEVARDTLLLLYGGELAELEQASRAVRGHWQRFPELAGRVRALLTERLDEKQGAPLAQRRALLQALGQVPGAATVDRLLAAPLSASERVGGLPAFRWLVRCASNAGDSGRAELLARWRTEADGERRLDLLEGATEARDDAARESLTEVVLAERSTPHERLFAAERLLRLGPAAEVAPLLKRACLRIEEGDVRRALTCLLWEWYG